MADFDGTVLFVSHDRYFVNRLADHLLVMETDRVRVVEGNYETYQRLVNRKSNEPDAEGAGEAKTSRSRKRAEPPDKSPKTGRPMRRFPYRKIADLEAEIFERESCLEQLHRELAKGETHRDGVQARRIKAEIAEQQETLRTLYEHWEEATELNW